MLIKILDKFFPFLAAILANKEISKETNEKFFKDSKDNWINRLSSSNFSAQDIEKIAHDVYSSQNQRISNIENKAISLLIAIGLSISLLAIINGFSNDLNISQLRWISISIFAIAIIGLVLSAGSAILAYRISKRFVPTTEEIKEIISNKKGLIEWAANHLGATELNAKVGLMKSNWVDAAQRQMLFSLISISIGSILLIVDVILSHMPNSISISISDNLLIFDNATIGT